MQLDKFEKSVSYVRFISIIAVIASGLGSLLMYVIGAVKVIRAFKSYFFPDLAGGACHYYFDGEVSR